MISIFNIKDKVKIRKQGKGGSRVAGATTTKEDSFGKARGG
jgi:hypothetical protein